MKAIIRSLIFTTIGILLFSTIQTILSDKFIDDTLLESEGSMINEFNEINKDEIQVAAIGASGFGWGIDPMKIYKDTQITEFNLVTGGQPIAVSYFLCNELFKRHHPELIILDASNIYNNEFWNAGYRYILDTVPLSKAKIDLAKYYANEYSNDQEGEKRSEYYSALISALFPIYQYHDRWSSLNKSDFRFLNCDNRNEILKGHWFYNTITYNHISNELMNEQADKNYWTIDLSNGMPQCVENEMYNPIINEKNWEYVLKIKRLCENNKSKFLLIKTPSIGSIFSYDAAWTKVKSNILKEIAEKSNVEYIAMPFN